MALKVSKYDYIAIIKELTFPAQNWKRSVFVFISKFFLVYNEDQCVVKTKSTNF